MSDFTIRRIDEMEAYYLGAMKRARAELGVTSFGLQVMDLPPNLTQLSRSTTTRRAGRRRSTCRCSGSGEIELDGERHPLEPGVMVRVGPAVRRKLWPGEDGMRVLAIGGVPGGVYEAPDVTELGQPDPMAR